MIKLSIIIVNYHSEKLLENCLASVFHANNLLMEVIVVNNNEGNKQINDIREKFPLIRLIENGKNIGFAAANNIAIKESKGDYLLLLNPDASLYPEAACRMTNFMDNHPDAGIIGAQLLDTKGNLHPQPSCTGIFPSPLQALFEYANLTILFPCHPLVRDYFLFSWDHKNIREIATVQGACFMARRQLLENEGLLDERFFLYWEETDLCLRAKKAGWKVFYFPQAQCTHIGGQSTINKKLDYYHFFKSMYRFHKKHYGAMPSILLRIILACAFTFGIFKLALQNAMSTNNTTQPKLKPLLNSALANLGIRKTLYEG